MRRFIRALACCAATASFLCFGLSSAQAAHSGSLTIAPLGADQITVSGTATYDCASTGNIYCGWFPDVSEVLAGQPCVDSPLEYVGPITESPTASFTYNFDPYNWTYGQTTHPGIRLCLYINYPSYQSVLVGQADYTPPAPTPSPLPPTPGPQPPSSSPTNPTGTGTVETLSQSEAKASFRRVLRRRLGKKFTRGRHYRASCNRLSRLRMKCKASWIYQGRWRATGTVRASADSLHWTFGVHRPAKPSPTPPAPPGGGGFCDTHPCIPNFDNGTGYIVQCNDGMWSHSGGRPGACSGHGGVSGASVSVAGRQADRLQAAHQRQKASSLRNVRRSPRSSRVVRTVPARATER